MIGVRPVSYTHLDVYKRQVQTTAPQTNFVPKAAVFDLPNLFPNKKVAETIYNMVDFGGDAHEALVALLSLIHI